MITAVVFAIVLVAGFVMAFARHPIYGLYAYLWVYYQSPQVHWWGALLPDLRWLLIAAVVALLATFRLKSEVTRDPWHANWGARFLVMFVTYMWLQVLWSGRPGLQVDGAILYTKHLIIYYIIYRVLVDEPSILKFSLAHVAGCAWFGWTTMGTAIRLENVGGGLSGSNAIGAHQVNGLMFAALLFLIMKGRARWIAFAAIPFILNTIILAQGRGTFLGMIAAGLVGFYLIPRRYGKWYLGAGALGLVLLAMLADEDFKARMLTMTAFWDETAEVDRSAESRIEIAGSGWALAKRHPFGGGYRATGWLNAQEGRTSRRAHSSFMSVLAEQGFPGALMFLGLGGWVFSSVRRLKRMEAQGLPPTLGVYQAILGAAMTSAFVSGIFSNLAQLEVVFWCLALLAATFQVANQAVAVTHISREAQMPKSLSRHDPKMPRRSAQKGP